MDIDEIIPFEEVVDTMTSMVTQAMPNRLRRRPVTQRRLSLKPP